MGLPAEEGMPEQQKIREPTAVAAVGRQPQRGTSSALPMSPPRQWPAAGSLRCPPPSAPRGRSTWRLMMLLHRCMTPQTLQFQPRGCTACTWVSERDCSSFMKSMACPSTTVGIGWAGKTFQNAEEHLRLSCAAPSFWWVVYC